MDRQTDGNTHTHTHMENPTGRHYARLYFFVLAQTICFVFFLLGEKRIPHHSASPSFKCASHPEKQLGGSCPKITPHLLPAPSSIYHTQQEEQAQISTLSACLAQGPLCTQALYPHTHTYIRTHMRTRTYIDTRTDACRHTNTHTHTHIYIHTHARMHAHIHIRTHTHTHTYGHTYIDTHA